MTEIDEDLSFLFNMITLTSTGKFLYLYEIYGVKKLSVKMVKSNEINICDLYASTDVRKP